MKRKFSKYTRKTLSVFMAVIMVLSVFVFVPEMFTKAEAATAGSYTLVFSINVTNQADKQSNIQDSYYTITYTTNNGKGSPTTMTYSLKDNWTTVGLNSEGEKEFSVTVPGWPTKVDSYHDAVWNDKVYYTMNKITVKGPSASEKAWSGSTNVHSGGWGNNVDRDSFTLSATAPAATSISLSSTTAQTVTVPESGTVYSANSNVTATVKDQYGVNWYQDATWVKSTSSTGATSDTSMTGITTQTGRVSVDKNAKTYLGSSGTKTIYLNAHLSSLKSSVIKVTITNRFTITFKNYDGTTLSESTYVYNSSVSEPSPDPTKPYDSTNHYVFSGWDSTVGKATADKTYTAQFTTTAHSCTPEVTTQPTCTTVGVTTYTCSCGYSYAEITPTVAKTKVYEGAITNNIKGSYTYLGVTAEKPTDMVSQTQPNCKTTATGTYGTINIENGEAVYTVTTMQFSGTETFYLLTKVENINSNNGALSAYVFEKVTIVPAKTLYYEDNFSSADGITYTDGVCSDGSSRYGVWNKNNASSVNVAADEAADLVYNSDDKNYAMLSGSSAHTVSVSELNKGNGNQNWPSATFTFAGTGFDVISLTDSDSGVFYVTVYKGTDTAGELVKTVLMDTYYGYTYSPLYFSTVTRKIVGSPEEGVTVPLYPSKITDKNNIPANDTEYIVTSNGAVYTTNTAKASSAKQAYGWVKTGNAQTLYQVPVIHIDGLAYGTYTAKIEARFTGLFGHYNTDETGVKYYDLCIDAIRINNPFNTANADEAYEQSGQSRVNYIDIKSALSSAEAASEAHATGLILLDGGKTVSQGSLEDYKEVLPKNEIYLSGNQSVAFDIDTADYEDVLIGMRSANATPLTAQIIYDAKATDIVINSGTELYYSILTALTALGEESINGTVVIKNTTDGAILSMTKMKTVAKENTVSAAAMPMTLSMFTAPRAMALLAMTESDLSIDEESVETATEEGKITLSVTTGADVSSLIIRDENGNELTPDEVNSVVSGDEIKWTVTLTETESGRYTYSLEGAYENGYTNGDTVEITVDVEITEPIPEEPEIPSDETEDSGKTDSFIELFDFLVSLLKKLLSRIFGVELV